VSKLVAVEDASGLRKLSDEIAPFHQAISFIWWSAGRSSKTIIQ
jgi:hypothetical protein